MKKIVYASAWLLPVLAAAQSVSTVAGNLTGIADSIRTVLNAIVPLLIGLAVIYFLWGMIQFVMSAGDDKKRGEGKNRMIWGIVAIAVMVSIYGLIAFLQNSLGFSSGGSITPPTI